MLGTYISYANSAATRRKRELRFFPFSTGRPLFAFLIIAAAAIGAAILLLPQKIADYEPYRGETVRLTGTVCSLEQKLQEDTVVWRMLLSDVRLESPAAVSSSPRDGQASPRNRKDSPLKREECPQSRKDFPLNRRDRVLCLLDHEPGADMSARVRVEGKLAPFRGAMNEGEFDPGKYCHILRIAFSLRDLQVLAASAPTDRISASLFHIKKHISSLIDRLFSRKNSPALKAMLLGEKGLLEEETKELYQGAGIIHILSISGLHLSLLGMGLFSLTGKNRRIPTAVRAAISITAVFLYGKMIGMGTSVFRALIMLVLYIISKVVGRTYDSLTAAAIAAILLLLEQPLYLLHTGFQFSFGAVLAIGILLPALPGRGLKAVAIPLVTLPVYLWAYGTFPIPSLLINLVVIPLMTVVMVSAGGTVLLVILAGLLKGLTGPLLSALHFPSKISSAFSWIPRLTGLPAELILDFYRFLAESSKKIPGRELVLGRPSPIRILLFYSMLALLAAISIRLQMPHMRRRIETAAVPIRPAESPLRKKDNVWSGDLTDLLLRHAAERICRLFRLRDNRERKSFACILIGLWMAAAVLVLVLHRPPAFEMDMLYVGQGDGILIRSGGRTLLIDGGSSTKEELARYTLLPFLHCKGVGRLDGIILTHEDIDHCSGLLAFLEAAAEDSSLIPISAVYLPDIAETAKGDNYRRIEALSEQAGIPVHYICRGQRIRSGALTLDCLHPARGASYENANEYSTTLLLGYGISSQNDLSRDRPGKASGFSALLTGDLEGQGEADLLQYLAETQMLQRRGEWLDVNILKVAHHGSRNATSQQFLQTVHPDMALISAGVDNMYGHPSEELLDRLESSAAPPDIYRTDLQGEISIRHGKKGDGYQVKTFLGGTRGGSEE